MHILFRPLWVTLNPNQTPQYSETSYNLTTFDCILYPYYIPSSLQQLSLEWIPLVEILLTAPPVISGNMNILDIVQLVNLIMSDGYQENLDLNNDGILDVFDVVSLINQITGDN